MEDRSEKIIPAILVGGVGTRLWPLSRRQYPKQFIDFDDKGSLFQKTLSRCRDAGFYSAPLVITNEDYRFLVAQQAEDFDIDLAGILLEPAVRNTAPALAVVAHYVTKECGSETIIHVMPSDHNLEFDGEMKKAVYAARDAATDGKLVTFGIKPTEPATGYGYIEAGNPDAYGVAPVKRFIEKPDRLTAEKFLAQGSFYWNSGMFVFAAGEFANELADHAPAIAEHASKSLKNATRDLDFVRLDAASFEAAPSISVDYAIFEKTDRAVVVPVNSPWSDLGSWDAIQKALPADADGNAGKGSFFAQDAANNLIMSDHQLVTLNKVENLAVVATDDAILISHLDHAEDVKGIVDSLKEMEHARHLADEHRLTYRPWGGYVSMLRRERFQIKRLFVKPGARLSLQKHHHRAEHWVIVSGTAEVTVNENMTMLGENQSIYIPLGAIHRLTNPGKITLEVIEVQIGSYLGEDDIVRIEDEFGRV